MRHFYKFLLTAIIAMVGFIPADAIWMVSIKPHSTVGDEFSDPDRDPHKHRLPSRPVEIIIGENGIDFSGALAEDEILLYEIWGFDGSLILSTPDEVEFINILFSQTEPVDIKIITVSAEWTGTVMM